jgi:hypothetical protein
VPKLVDLQLPWTIRLVRFEHDSLAEALRMAATYVDKRMSSDDWDVNKRIYDVVISPQVSDNDDDETKTTWLVTLLVEGGTNITEKQQEIENERNFLLRRISELESKLGLNPWWMKNDNE